MIGRLGIILFSSLLLALWALPAVAQETGANAAVDTVVKTVCVSALDYDALEEIKGDLQLRAKREAAAELFGELIVAATEVDNLVVTSDQIRLQSLGLLRLDGSATYSNGANFLEACVTITAYVTAQDKAQFEPESVSGRHCVTDPVLPVPDLRTRAEEGAQIKALLGYDSRLAAYAAAAATPLLRRVTYSESDLLAGTDTYCATVRGVVVPIEVVSFLSIDGDLVAGGDAGPVAASAPTAARQPAAPTRANTPAPAPTMSPVEATAVAQMATLAAFQSRTPTPTMTPTPTPTSTPTPNTTATAVALMLDVYATAEAAGHNIADLAVNPVDGAAYVYVPAGEFLMGSADGEGSDNEQPQHTVYLDAFWIMQTEVTNAQYARCVAAGACSAPDNDIWQEAGTAQHPVTHVTWDQARTYAKWAGGSLPTEAQWEKACRGADARLYPWGTAAPHPDLLNYAGSEIGDTAAAGSYPGGASPYGALDMAGNVWEWTADRYDGAYYAQSPAENPPGPSRGQTRVLRGGSFYNYEDLVRCASRVGNSPSNGGSNGGFRVASPSF